MSIKPHFETYRYTTRVCRAGSQSIVECRLPGGEIAGVLAIHARAVPAECVCADGEVRYNGKLFLSVVYEDADRKVCRAERGAEFSHRAENPAVTFVAAHPGEREYFLKHLQRLEKYENAYLDLSGTGLFRYGLVREGIRRAGAGKFLFGTDYPITNPGMYVHAVLGEHIGEEDRRLIFSGNAKRLLRLMPEAM